ncbi:hypothetical protein BJ912DRAFT_953461 [Pholiota molesta]|nr:hypothetical protein BJ912DRAFT_953461 [Pholiota molesta]
MFRLVRSPRSLSCFPRPVARSLVSSALLSRAWQNESIAELRNEAKLRGLSAKGSKTALASRIEEHENSLFQNSNVSSSRQSSSVSSPSPSSNSTDATNTTEAPGNPEPPAVPPVNFVLDTKIPDLSAREPLPQVQVPFVPDYWNSSEQAQPVAEEEVNPKIVVVAGAETHHGGGPFHNFLEPSAPHDKPDVKDSPKSSYSGSFLDDIAEDLGLPPVQEIKKGLSSFVKSLKPEF